MGQRLTGAEILLESLIAEGVDTVFGYPGGSIITVYYQSENHGEKPCLMATKWRLKINP